MDISCAILAGGQSTRMGRDKATVQVGDRGLIEHVYSKVHEIFDDIFIVSSYHERIEGVRAPIVPDVLPYSGSLVGIISALLHSRTPYVFVVACDMPFLDADFIHSMLQRINGQDIIVPKGVAGYEPLHAIYNRFCLSYMLKLIDANRFRIDNVFPYLTVETVDGDSRSSPHSISAFTNVNTEADLEHVRDLL